MDAIFKSHDLNTSVNENDQNIEKSKPIIFEPTLIEIEEVKNRGRLTRTFLFDETKNSIDFQKSF